MHAYQLCQKYFTETPTTFHGSRKTTIQTLVMSLLGDAQLTLTSLGRHLPGRAYVKHKIKRVDRFLGNWHVHRELPLLYSELLVQPLLTSLDRLVIAVDWSGCCTPDYHVLRASLLYQGRAIPLYNKVVPEALHESEVVQSLLLDELHKMIGDDKTVWIVTDGGFKTPWFTKVRSLGWDYVGRVRGRIHCQLGEADWQDIKGLHRHVRVQPRYRGAGLLGKTSETQCATHFYTVKQRLQGRHAPRVRYPDAERRYQQLQREPWVIVTSLAGGQGLARPLVNLYKKRMQIEQNFRDDKNPRWGFAWRYSRTRDAARISVLCLIASLATLVLWLVGFAAEQLHWQRRFQANTVKDKRVLSYLSLAKQLLRQVPEKLPWRTLHEVIPVFIIHYKQDLDLIWSN